jgi:hypothetical protein
MTPVKFYFPILLALEDGKVIRAAVAWALRIVGVLQAAAGLFLVIEVLKFSFRLESGEATLGGMILAAVVLVSVACIAQICFYRATSIDNLGDSIFTVTPVLSILLRAAGEVYATAGVAIGVGGCLFLWFAKINPLSLLGEFGELLPSSRAEGTFLGGLAFLAYLSLASFAWLIICYFLAETVVVLADIARNVRLLARPAGQPGAAAADGAPSPPLRRCPTCGEPLGPGIQFCEQCGTRALIHPDL